MASQKNPEHAWLHKNDSIGDSQLELSALERREWWSWGAALTIICILTGAMIVLSLSSSQSVLTPEQRDLVFRGLVPLVVLFSLFSIRQQMLIGRLRRQLATQIGIRATMEVLRAPDPAQREGWQNRRSKPRYYFDQRIKVQAGKDTFHGRTRDISQDGIGVVIPDEVPTGSRVRLEFPLGENRTVLGVEAILRHHRGFYNGFEFVDLTPENRTHIHSVCAGVEVPDIRQRVGGKSLETL